VRLRKRKHKTKRWLARSKRNGACSSCWWPIPSIC